MTRSGPPTGITRPVPVEESTDTTGWAAGYRAGYEAGYGTRHPSAGVHLEYCREARDRREQNDAIDRARQEGRAQALRELRESAEWKFVKANFVCHRCPDLAHRCEWCSAVLGLGKLIEGEEK